jgi:hypothetical protein
MSLQNVDAESEMEMLRAYAPSVPEFLLRALVDLFGELRSMVDAGLLQYPYSMREIVQVAKHLGTAPQCRLPCCSFSSYLRVVFDRKVS